MNNLTGRTDRILEAGIVLLLVVPVAAYAGVPAWPEAIARGGCLLLGALLALQTIAGRDAWKASWAAKHHSRRPLAPFPLLFVLIVVYGALMLAPLPAPLHRFVSPASWSWHAGAAQLSAVTGPGRFPLSMSPGATAEALLALAAWCAFFLVCAGNNLPWRFLRRVTAAFLGTVFAVSVLGTVQWLTAGKSLWGALVADPAKHPFGPFVNRNHFADWAGMGALLGLGYFLSMFHRREAAGNGENAGRHFAPPERGEGAASLVSKRFLVGFMTAVITASVFLSLSRGGAVSLLAGLAFFSLLVGTRRRLGGAWGIAGLLLAGLAVVCWVGAEPVIERLGTLFNLAESSQARVDLNRDLLRMADDFPWTGTGPGTFGEVFPAFQTALPQTSFTYGHNDYLQLLAEWGLVGAGLFATALGVFWWRFFRRWRNRRDREALYLSAGAAGGMVVMLTHAAVDFPFHIPANALAFAFLAGLALKASTARTLPPPATPGPVSAPGGGASR